MKLGNAAIAGHLPQMKMPEKPEISD
jgi:hypothetical protein